MHCCRVGLIISAIMISSAASAPPAAAQGWAVFAINNKVYRTTVGGTPEQVYDGSAAHACWSAQGRYIYVIKHNGQIWRMGNDGSNPKKISSAMVTDYNPIAAYRPDDEYLLYVQGKTFYRVDGNTGAKTPIYSGTKSYDGEIAISMDGKRLAGRDSRNDLYRIDLDPASSRYKTEVLYDTDCSSSLSPNGQYLTANVDGHVELSIIKWSGSSLDCEKDGSCYKDLTAPTGVKWDNQRFAVNSNDYVAYRQDDGKAVGIVRPSSNSKTKICNMGPAYVDFLVGNLPTPPQPPANKPPSVAIDSPADGARFEPGDAISYSGSASDPEDGTLSGSALSWTIDRDGDGQGAVHSSGGTSGSYTFPDDIDADTRYAVKLSAKDARGLTDIKTISVWVRPPTSTTNSAPAINEVIATPHPVDQDVELTLSCSAIDPDGDTLSYAWTFGDDSTGTGASATHTYATAGSFEVEVKVDDGQGHEVTESITVTVTDPALADLVVIEAETMDLSGYEVEGPFIATMDSGTATASFPGRSGRYRVEIIVIKENDGQPQVVVSAAGTELASLTYDLGGTSRDPETIDLGEVVLSQGDAIEIAGHLDDGAAARVDKLVFHEQEPAPPTKDGGVIIHDPDASPAADAGVSAPEADATGTNSLEQDSQMTMSSGCSVAHGPQFPTLLLGLLMLLCVVQSRRRS